MIEANPDENHFNAGKILQRPVTGLATSLEKIQKDPGQVQRMVRAFLRATRALKTERAGFIAFAQRKYGYSKDVMEEADKYLVEALSQDGFVDDSSLQAAIDEAKSLAKITKPINQSDIVDYSFLRAAVQIVDAENSPYRLLRTANRPFISTLPAPERNQRSAPVRSVP